MSPVFKEVVGFFGLTLKHATTKHAQKIGLLERSSASIKQTLKVDTSQRRSMWHEYVSLAVLIYNPSYHASIGCEPSRVFHGRFPYNILDLKMGNHPQKKPSPDSQIAQDVLDQIEMISLDVLKNAMQAHIKYKAFCDKKANASELKQADYFYVLQPKQITKEVKLRSQIFGRLDFIFLKSCYPTIIIWYAKLAPIKRKYFIE